MRIRLGIPLPWILIGAVGIGALSAALIGGIVAVGRQAPKISEIRVAVVDISRRDMGGWWVPKDAVAETSGTRGPFVARARLLRAERLSIEIVRLDDDQMLVKNDKLKPTDLLIVRPHEVPPGQSVNITAGVNDERLVRLTIEAGIAAAMAEDLDESTRFLSTDYNDASRLNFDLLRGLLKRAFRDFDEPRIEMIEAPTIHLDGTRAKVLARIRVEAGYGGRRNYLLGDQSSPNEIVVFMEKSSSGWKICRIQGLNPLGLGEKFLRLLGAEVGLTLSPGEARDKRETCMPCRQRMAERFGSGPLESR